MARRSDYPFHKSDLKFGTNLIATLFSIPISLGARAVIDGSKDLLSTYPTDTAKLPSEATQGKIGRLEFAIGVVVLILLFILGVYWTSLPIVGFLGVGFAILWLVLLVFFISAFVVNKILPYKDNEKELSRRFAWDFQNSREILLKEIYKQYGGTWKPELLNQLEVWSCI